MQLFKLAVLSGLVSISFLVGCKSSKPDQALLSQFIASEQKTADGLLVSKLPVEEQPFNTRGNDALRQMMQTLGNDMGFRIEVETVKKGYFPAVKKYTITESPKKELPGLTFRSKDGVGFEVILDAAETIVISKAQDPAKGMEDWLEETTKASLESADSKEKSAIKARISDRVESFKKNIETVQKDLGAKRAWLVTYRKRVEGKVPTDSPVWPLLDAFSSSRGSYNVIIPGVFLLTHEGWLKAHGEQKVKDTLSEFLVVLFEGQDGKIIKKEGYKTFIAE